MFSYTNIRAFFHDPLGKIVFSRWLIAALILVAPIANRLFHMTPLFLTLRAIVIATIVYSVCNIVLTSAAYVAVTRGSAHAPLIGVLHIFLDILGVTTLVYLTGATDSTLYTLYVFPILFSMILYFDSRVFVVVASSVVIYCSLIFLDSTGVIPHVDTGTDYIQISGDLGATAFRTVMICIQATGVIIVAWMIRRIMSDREMRINREKKNMQTLVEAIPQGLVMVDQFHRIVMMNASAREYMTLDDTNEKSQKEFLPDVESSCDGKLYRILREQPAKKVLNQSVRITCGERDRDLLVNTLPITDKDQPKLWLHILHDVTERNAFDRLKSDFVSIAAHQLRTPLSGLKWFFDQFIEEAANELTVDHMGQLVAAQGQNEKIIEMVNDLLHMSEIEAQETTLQLKPIAVRDLVGTVVHGANQNAIDQGVGIHSTGFEGHVLGDWRQLHMMLSNLVENAVKYSPQQSVVNVSAQKTDSGVRFTVRDEGIGIASEDHERIFMRFFRTREAQRVESSGSGLGLYIVRKIVRAHGGRISVDSTVGKGTTFIVDIPS